MESQPIERVVYICMGYSIRLYVVVYAYAVRHAAPLPHNADLQCGYGLSTTTVLPLHVYRREVRRLGSPAVSPNISVQCDAVEQSGHGTHRLALIL